jgi:hypothetical protein
VRSIGRQGLAAAIVLALPAASCLDSGHLLGSARATGQSASGTGGVTSTSGSNGNGGSVASGGAAGTAGTAGAGGATGGNISCGGPSGGTCPVGQFCDLASNCGMIVNAPGVCMPFGGNVICSDQAMPVCGCEGRTYPNDCQRAAAGMLKAMDGVCADSVASYPSAYLAWQTSTGLAGSGPAAAVKAPDWLVTWASTASFPPESLPGNLTAMHPLTSTDTDDLFLRLAGVNVSALPHGPSTTSDCQATLYFRLCEGCAANTLTYNSADQIGPEMELIWSWFDRMLGATAMTNPRNFCGP